MPRPCIGPPSWPRLAGGAIQASTEFGMPSPKYPLQGSLEDNSRMRASHVPWLGSVSGTTWNSFLSITTPVDVALKAPEQHRGDSSALQNHPIVPLWELGPQGLNTVISGLIINLSSPVRMYPSSHSVFLTCSQFLGGVQMKKSSLFLLFLLTEV